MVSSLALFLSAIAGGTIATYAYEDEAPVGWRIAAGSASGTAVLGLAILALALRWGLNGPTLAASAFIAALPLLLLTNARLRARVCADTYRVGERLRSTGPRDAISFALALLLALVVWRVLDRVVLEQPAGMSTGFANNFGDLPFHAGAITRFAFGDNQPWQREIGGRVFNLAVRVATGLPYWDTQCGFKAFRMSVCRPIIAAAAVDRFGFDVELLYVAERAGLRLREIPVRWDHCDGSKVCVRRDAVRMLGEIRQIRSRAARGMYEAAIREATTTAVHEQPQLKVAFAG